LHIVENQTMAFVPKNMISSVCSRTSQKRIDFRFWLILGAA